MVISSFIGRRGRRARAARRTVALGSSAALVLGLGAAAAAAAPAAPASPQPVHRRATVVETTDRSQTVRNADGSYTLRVSATPQRIRTASGWRPIDTRLVHRADGYLTPRASEVAVGFGAGGDRHLLEVGTGGSAVVVDWARALPRPVIKGAAATYRNVLPWTDLVLTAQSTSYTAALVLHSRAAAASPALRSVRYLVRRLNDAKPAAALNAGPTVARPVTPALWDSAGPRGLNGPTDHAGRGVAAQTSMTALDPASSQIDVRLPQSWLGAAARRYPVYVGVPVTGSVQASAPAPTGSVRPAATAATTAGGTVGSSRSAWTSVDKPYVNSTTGDYNSSNVARVGYESQDGMTYQSFFTFGGLSAMAGATVLSAEFDITEVWSWSCSARSVELWRAGGFTSSTTWNTKPALMTNLGAKSVAYGYSSSCPSKAVGWDWKSLAQALASAHSSTVGFGLKASDETDTYGWKKFDNGATIAITYNFTPTTPTGMTTDTSTACDSTNPPYLAVTNPKLTVTAADKNTSDSLWVTFEWQKTDGTSHNSHQVGPQAQGKFAYSLPSGTFASGSTWEWRAHSTDGTATSGSSAWCAFKVDTTKPPAPTISSPCDAADSPCSDLSTVLPGTPQSFTLTAPASDTSISAIYYSWGVQPEKATTRWKVPVTSGQSATVTIVPPLVASNTPVLYAQTYSSAGLFSTNWGEYNVWINPPQLDAYWTFDNPQENGADGNTVTVDPNNPSIPSWAYAGWPANDMAFTDTSAAKIVDAGSQSGYSLLLNKSGTDLPAPDGKGTAASQVSALDTSAPGSFTVTAWANTMAPATQLVPFVIVSQDGVHSAPWILDRTAAGGQPQWRFSTVTADTDTPAVSTQVMTPIPSTQLNAWVHLVASYDAGAHLLHLWVVGPDGVQKSVSATGDVKFAGTGPIRLGAVKYRSGLLNYWSGAIDEVRIYSGAVDDTSVQQLLQTAPQP